MNNPTIKPDKLRIDLPTGAAPPRSLASRAGQALLVAAIMFSSLGLYLLVLNWRGHAALFTTHIPLDDWIPYRPEWVWVYLIPYLIGPATIGLLSWDTCRWFIARGLVIIALTLLIFILVPTQTKERPLSDNLGDGLTARLYRQMVEVDEPPANAAPSLHVSLTLLLAWALLRDLPRWWPVTVAGVGVVWLSTLMTRQHHLIDVATGAALAAAVVLAWPRGRSSREGAMT
jgi:membrane-associated phospholipid phosphatase